MNITMLAVLMMLGSPPAAAQLYPVPYQGFIPLAPATGPIQSEYQRERDAKRLIDYQVEQQNAADRRLEYNREVDRMLERLHRGY